jgi:predicted nucleotide-binding protein
MTANIFQAGTPVKKEKSYDRVTFNPAVLAEGIEVLHKSLKPDQARGFDHLTVRTDAETWDFDTFPEFLSAYAKVPQHALLTTSGRPWLTFSFFRHPIYVTSVSVRAESRELIESIFNVFELHAEESREPEPEAKPMPKPPIRVFIGHGGSQQWRDLKDHLQDKHGIQVEAYEIGARAGHAIRDILGDMLISSSFACLVLTGEDETSDGKLLARQNVIHETGLFQGRLGFNRAIVLLEDGTEEFSNLAGIQQIRFSKGNIKETFGEVLATLRREFAAAQ